VAFGASTTLNELYALIKDCVQSIHPETPIAPPVYRDFRKGDVRQSLADITRAENTWTTNPNGQSPRACTQLPSGMPVAGLVIRPAKTHLISEPQFHPLLLFGFILNISMY